MNLQRHITDTIKEWQLKIGYREGPMKLYYPGESLAVLLGTEQSMTPEELGQALNEFCDEAETMLGRIRISGSFERYCLDIPAKGCAYVAGKVEEPEFLKRFLETITSPGSTMEQIRECFGEYAERQGTDYVEDLVAEEVAHEEGMLSHTHAGHAFYFVDDVVEEYVYWVEENEFGLTYHRFTREDYERLK